MIIAIARLLLVVALLGGCAAKREAVRTAEALRTGAPAARELSDALQKSHLKTTAALNDSREAYLRLIDLTASNSGVGTMALINALKGQCAAMLEKRYATAGTDIYKAMKDSYERLLRVIAETTKPIREFAETRAETATKLQKDAMQKGDLDLRARLTHARQDYLLTFSVAADLTFQARDTGYDGFDKILKRGLRDLTTAYNAAAGNCDSFAADYEGRIDQLIVSFSAAGSNDEVEAPEAAFQALGDYIDKTGEAGAQINRFLAIFGFGRGSLFNTALSSAADRTKEAAKDLLPTSLVDLLKLNDAVDDVVADADQKVMMTVNDFEAQANDQVESVMARLESHADNQIVEAEKRVTNELAKVQAAIKERNNP